jgi:NAD+ kinase
VDLHDLVPEARRMDPEQPVDVLVTLGGDGTMLRGARTLGGRQVPIIGVNLGRLGFLTSCGDDEMVDALCRFARGDYRAEPRMALDARAIDRNGVERRRWYALNDVVLHKGGFARVVRLAVSSNGEAIAAYGADGIVLSTPTGSTAYSLSAGGPVVEPTVDSIRVWAEDGPEELLVTVDGQVGTTFAAGEVLEVRRAGRAVLLVRFPGTTYYGRLRKKLGWGWHAH